MSQQEILERLLAECAEDHVGLWRILSAVRFDLHTEDSAKARAHTLRLVRALLQQSGVRAGHPAPGGKHFIPWDLNPEQIIRRVDEEWSALGREPNIGEIVWFTTDEDAAFKPDAAAVLSK